MRKILLIFAMCFALIGSAFAQQPVTGTVTGDDGLGIPGVSVVQKGTTNGTITNVDGKFTINVPSDAILSFSFVGMAPVEESVTGRSTINIVMVSSTIGLNEVVVTAMGVSKERKALGYAMSTIPSVELTKVASTNFATTLYGKAPGVRVAAAPGGATSAVNINIRGVNSITGKSQPLIVVDGVPIRDGEVNNSNFWGDQRLRGNGLIDLNPEDIENISILKGASAAALYGSEAVNGVVLITTKSGKGTKGFKVDVVTNIAFDNVAYLPEYQDKYGPGYPVFIANAGQDSEGWLWRDLDGDGVKESRGHIGTNLNFGPAFDGTTQVMAWDGKVRTWEAQKDSYASLFQTAVSSNISAAVSMGSENSNSRLSLTRQDNQGVSLNSKNERNIANLNSSFKLGENYTIDFIVNFINQTTHNRPYSVDRLWNNFGGMMTRFDNGEWYFDRYKTSKGYKYVTGTNQSLTPDENIVYGGYRPDVLDYLWNVNEVQLDEYSNRVIGNLTNTWQITNDLKLRGRVATDFTSEKTEQAEPNTIPLAFGNSGYFSLSSYQDNILYGDIMANYSTKITDEFTLGANAGYTAQKQTVQRINFGTNGGLSTENMFDISASVNTPTGGSSRSTLVKDAFFGTLNFDYNGYLFVEGTVRRDRTSTMNPDNNAFVYPSVNSSFLFSEAFEMPTWIDYGKLRASWGIVGNYPDIYSANIAYNQNTMGVQAVGGKPVLYTTIPTSLGNDGIRPEEKHEFEFGLEMNFMKNRLGIDASYFNATIVDQILPLTTAISTGAGSVLTNIGTLKNSGVEIALRGVPVQTNNFRWESTLNFANYKNTVEKLTDGATELLHADYDGGAAQLRSVVGESMGDIYVHPVLEHENGGLVVDPNGLYKVDANKWIKVGNAMPKVTGGFLNTFTYKSISIDATIDYRLGGHIMPTALNWMISRGLLTDALDKRDAESGGLSYYVDGDGVNRLTDAAAGPNGELVYHDGRILEGVKADGTSNDYVASSAYYYFVTYNWGGPQYSPNTRYELFVKENSYIKMRELVLRYALPKSLVSKIGLSNLEISAFGRNLFFIYKTIDHMDPEQATAGSRWFQTVNNVGTNPATRTFGGSLRFSF
ncbi:MAG TPA: SusC/RagA family TonB-linked outer membrane protein [Prolixibacteraceae bacterium]|nr:SusC/RagA family TonB-linked outer membrane protein [Prolixibacteraceae bacterium]